MEYLYFYYYRDGAVEHIRGRGGSRGRQLAGAERRALARAARRDRRRRSRGRARRWERAMAERDATYFARERGEILDEERRAGRGDAFEGEGYEGVATAVMAAAVQRRKSPLILNVANRGAIGGLRDDDVVEVTCLVDEHGAHPIAQGSLPERRRVVRQVKLYERLTVRAAVEGSRRMRWPPCLRTRSSRPTRRRGHPRGVHRRPRRPPPRIALSRVSPRRYDAAVDTWLVLLRGINVGGNRVSRCADLRDAFAAMGFVDPVTYIQSGNVLVGSRRKKTAAAVRAIERGLSSAFGYDARVIVRDRAEMDAIVPTDPEDVGCRGVDRSATT